MEEIFKPTPFSTWANDAVRIRMVRNASDLGDPTRQFQPLFTHQVFGGKEEIVGFENPVVQIIYAANTLRPCICFGASEKVARSQLKDLGLRRTDVLECIRKHAPADYTASMQDVLDDAADAASNQPIGKLVWRYTDQHRLEGDVTSSVPGWMGGPAVPTPRPRPEESEDTSGNEFRVYQTDLESEEAQVLLNRVQSLAIWLIERASYIKPDNHWQLLTLYEHQGVVRAQDSRAEGGDGDVDLENCGDGEAQFVGFVTLYKDYTLLRPTKRGQSAHSRCSSSSVMDRDDTEDADDGDAGGGGGGGERGPR